MQRLRLALVAFCLVSMAVFSVTLVQPLAAHAAPTPAVSCPFGGNVPLTSDTTTANVHTVDYSSDGATINVTVHAELYGIFADNGDGPFCQRMFSTITVTFNSCSANRLDCYSYGTASVYTAYKSPSGQYFTSPKGVTSGDIGFNNPIENFPPLVAQSPTEIAICGAPGGDLVVYGTDIHVGAGEYCD